MHELSIAQSIVQLSEQQAREHHSSQIEEVELETGCLAGVELQTLEFAMESAVKGTLLEKAKIIRRYVDGEGQCCDCETVFPIGNLFSPCPNCGSYLINITNGRELRIKSIVIK